MKPFGVKESKEKKQKKENCSPFPFPFCSRDRGRFVPPGEEEGKSKVPFLSPTLLIYLEGTFPFFFLSVHCTVCGGEGSCVCARGVLLRLGVCATREG